MLEPFTLPFVQRGLLEIGLLSVAGGLLGTWIVLRGLAFYAHAVGTAAFPGLVLADGLAFAAPIGALATAVLFTGGVSVVAGRRAEGQDAGTALVLVGFLAAGVLLASDVFASGANVDSLLFGSLLLLEPADVWFAGAASAAALAGSLLLGRRWLAVGFDAAGARALGVASPVPELVLLGLVALTTTAALGALGALLTSALFVIPAATVRLWARRLVPWQVGSVALVAIEGAAGLWLSVQTNTPPGPAIAVLAGTVFAVAAIARRVPRRRAGVAAGALAGVLALTGCGAGDAKTAVGAGGGVAASTQLKVTGAAEGGAASRADPHWWHDPRSAEVAVGRIRDAFARAAPSRRAAFGRRATAYLVRLRALDAGIRACLAAVPARDRKLVTDHDAFTSFTRRYGIRVVGAVIPSQSTRAQSSAGELAALARTIERERVKAVFPESSLSPRVAEAIARATGASADLTLYGDTLGPRGSDGATYLSSEAHNADAMVRGFMGGARGCEIATR